MDINLVQIHIEEKQIVLNMFKKAAEKISKMKIDHWQYWKNPPVEKVKWMEDGIVNKEFFFIQNSNSDIVGMIRVLKEDEMYWGKQTEKAKYVHSLVVKNEYNKKGIGEITLRYIENTAKDSSKYLRLDADSKNIKLCKYYEKQGFIKVGEKKTPTSTNNLYQKELI